MASWHQSRNPVKRWHETKWMVWLDPYGRPACAYECNSEEDAVAMADRLQANGHDGVYIVPPKLRIER